MNALGCILAIIFGLFWLIASAFITIYRAAFGSQSPKEKKQWTYTASSQSSQNTGNTRNANSRQRRRKLFDDNEGEYVDFVEVKD